jgi:chromosome segregation ATPase
MKRLKELTDELNTEKRRNNDLLKEKSDREREIQILHAQLDSIQYKHEPTSPHSQQNIQTLELQLKRVAEENIHLNHQLAQQQQQQQLTTSNLTNTGDLSNMKVQVLSEQIKKLSVDNANLEKKANSNESLAKEAQKEKERLIGYENTFVETFF